MNTSTRRFPNADRRAASTTVHSSPHGFALIMSLVLMGFLVLLLYSLTAITQIETQVSTTTQRMAQAQQNALTGLSIALGELQKYAGPDQRVTALADVDATFANSTTANGHWLGIYGNAAPIDYGQTPTAAASGITSNSNSKGSQAVLLNWLVSGNETATFNPVSDVDDDGHILTTPSGWTYTPSSAINLAQATITPGSNDSQVLLIGENSVSASSDYVTAPLVNVPDSNGSGTSGRYAWWVGDEGAKASVSLPMAGTTQLSAAFVSSQRNAIELVNEAQGNTYSAANLIGNNFDPTDTALTDLNSLNELPLVAAQDCTSMRTAVKNRFHDLTPYSYSVLSDTYAGGLKQDLSAVLATGSTSPANDDTIFTPTSISASDTFGVPTWGALRSFAQTTANSTSGLTPRLPTKTDVGIAPVLTYFSLGLQYAAPNGGTDNSVPGDPIRLAMFPVVVLWNPYTTTLKAHTYEVGMNLMGVRGQYQLQVYRDDATGWEVKQTVDFNNGAVIPTGGNGRYVRFKVDCPDIPPGQSLIFSLQNNEVGKDYEADTNGEPQNTLTNGLYAYGHVLSDFGSDNVYFTDEDFDTQTNTDGSVTRTQKDFRVTGAHIIGYNGYSMSGGDMSAYLGDVTDTARRNYTTSDSNDKEWYQTISLTSPANDGSGYLLNNRNEFLQTAGPLDYVANPTSAIFIQRLFGDTADSATYPDVRWVAQSNPRSLYSMYAVVKKNPTNITAGMGQTWRDLQFTSDTNGLRASSGPGMDSSVSIVDTTLFEFRPSDQPLISLGQLQHANLSYVNSYPAYPIGNSLGDFHFLNNRNQVRITQSRTEDPASQMGSYYDISWLLNRALWDKYFVSTVPHAGTGTSTDTNSTAIPDTLPNPRMVVRESANDDDLRDAELAAANLTLAGGFNINSTSEQAWRAVLGGINQLPYDPESETSSATKLQSALPRFSKPTNEPTVDTDQAWAWQGYRQLTDEQIAELAQNIVSEIRARGPFVSMGDFINRRLVDNSDTSADERFKGVLQAAIDATSTGNAAANSGTDTAYGFSGTNPFHSDDAPNYDEVASVYDTELMQGYKGSFDGNEPAGSLSAFAPQFLTQADILSAIGAGLSARSDTFRIRSYGEVTNPITGEPQARAWCEAVVQRQPEYLDDAGNAPEDTLTDLNDTNKKFGRKFKIVSFRWLSSDQI